MAIIIDNTDIRNLDMTTLGAMKSFNWTPHDDNYLEDPANVGVQVVSRGISLAALGAITYIDVEGKSSTVPSGFLAVGVIHPIRGIVKIMDMGTDAITVQVWH